MASASVKSGGAFNPKTVFAMVALGAIAFIVTLYLIGVGDTGGDSNNGGAHGAGKGLNGYAALASMLEEEGRDVSFSRSQGRLDVDGESLLILTPPHFADPAELTSLIANRRFLGPTMVILPKWWTSKAKQEFGSDVEAGWVELQSSSAPDWASKLGDGLSFDVSDSDPGAQKVQRWSGLEHSGVLPEPPFAFATGEGLVPLVVTGGGQVLAGLIAGTDDYLAVDEDPFYDEDAYEETYEDNGPWPVIFVVEPDLVNNYGLADRDRAGVASALVDAALSGEDLPVVFDLTLNGLGTSQNLLTLAFTAPFLAATLCLILAMIVVAWRAFRRFGPPVAEGRSIAFGKEQLVKNSAGFVQRSGRLHLLSHPYADMVRARIVKALALKSPDDEAIDMALAKRIPESETYSRAALSLRNARSPKDILRAAAALKTIERMLSK